MTCPEYERTSAFIDGELDRDAAAEAEHHIAGCAACQTFVAAAAEVSDALRRPAARYAAPEALRARIARDLDTEDRVAPWRAPGRSQRGFWWGAFSGVGVSGLAAALALVVLSPPSGETLATALTDAHVEALSQGRTIAVASSSHHTVKPWFAGRAPLSPPVTDFAPQGFPLVGGRVDVVAGAKAAVVVYGHGKHEIDLFVWAGRGTAPPAPTDRHGYHLVFWRQGDLDLAAVSDVQPGELNDFVRLVQTARE